MQALPANFYTWEFTFGGYQNSELNITNKSGKTLMGWELEFDYGGTINNVTNAIYDNSSHVGNHYIIKHADWIYKKVENGETIKLKLGTVYSYSQPPTNLVLKTFNLNAVEEFNQTEVNIMKYKWTRIGEEIINPGGDS